MVFPVLPVLPYLGHWVPVIVFEVVFLANALVSGDEFKDLGLAFVKI